MTSEIDYVKIKNMGQTLIAYSRLRTLTKMSRQQLAYMPKEVLIGCAANEIALVWDMLPEDLRNDSVVSKYQHCMEHYGENTDDSEDSDANDGPIPRKIFCCYCNVGSLNIVSDNTIGTPSPTASCCGFLLNPFTGCN